MAKTTLNVIRTDANTNEQLQKTLPDINPAATNEQIKSFAQALYGLSDDTYVESNRVDKINCDTEEGGTAKQFRNLTITNAAQGATATVAANISEGGSVNPVVFFYSGGNVQLLSTSEAESDKPTVSKRTFTVPNSSGQIFVGISESNKFYADFVSATVE